MTSYGFKLLKVDLRQGRRHAIHDFGSAKYLEKVSRDVEDSILRGQEARERVAASALEQSTSSSATAEAGIAAAIVTSEDLVEDDIATLAKKSRQQSVVRFEGVTRLKSALLLSIRYGIVGDHDKGVDPEELQADADLTRLATTRPYRAVLITPPTGFTGFLAVEVIGRSHAGGELPRRLYQGAQGHEYKLHALGPVADEPAVKELLDNGSVEEVLLIKTSIPPDSHTPRPPKSMTMTFKLGKEMSQGPTILKHAAKWLHIGKEVVGSAGQAVADGEAPEGIDSAAEANTLAAILWEEASDFGFDDVKVKIRSLKQKKTLQPLDYREGFVYRIGEKRATDNEFLESVNDAARLLFGNYEMDMEADWYLPKTTDKE